MEAKVYTEIRALFTEYLTEKKLRKTEERYAIFKEICAFPGHFDVCMLSDRLEQDTHLHLVCTRCGTMRELRNSALKADMRNLKVSRFTPEYYCLYIYGLCSKCKFKQQRSVK